MAMLDAMGKAPYSLTAAYRYLVMGTVGGTFILLGMAFLHDDEDTQHGYIS